MNQSFFAIFALALVLVGCDLDNHDFDDGPLPPLPSREAHYETPPGPNTLSNDSASTDAPSEMSANMGPSSQHGVYQGTLPCGDCSGIDTTLTLNLNDTYVIQKIYVGSDRSPVITSGSVSWSDDGNVLQLSGEDQLQNRYFVSNHQLTLLDLDSHAPHADELKYQLVQLP